MRTICRDCDCYCIHCGICHKDREYHEMNDSCRDFAQEDGEEESEVSE